MQPGNETDKSTLFPVLISVNSPIPRQYGNDTSCLYERQATTEEVVSLITLACGCDDVGSVNDSCSPLGECYCQPGVEGTKCDSCQPFHFNLSSGGCQPCGECEQMLQARLMDADSTLEGVVNDTEQLAGLIEADETGLGEVYATNLEIAANVTASEEYLDELGEQLQAFNSCLVSTETITQATENQVSYSKRNVDGTFV